MDCSRSPARGMEKITDSTAALFRSRIAKANKALAEVNIGEAESAIGRGACFEKAVEHLELAKSLSDDRAVQELAGQLLASIKDHSGPDCKRGINQLWLLLSVVWRR